MTQYDAKRRLCALKTFALNAILFASILLLNTSALISVSLAEDATKTTQPLKAEPVSISELVDQLGADEYALREEAERTLLSQPITIVPVLQIALKKAGLEERVRLARIIKKMERQGFESTIKNFVNDPQATLPHWDRFQKEIGATKAHRQLFARMFEAEIELFTLPIKSEDDDKDDLNLKFQNHIERRYLEYQRNIPNSVGAQLRNSRGKTHPSSLAVLFLSTTPDLDFTGRSISTFFSIITNTITPPNNNHFDPATKVYLHWAINCKNVPFRSRLSVAMRLNSAKTVIALSDEVIKQKNPRHQDLVTAMFNKAQYAKEKVIPDYLAMLQDKTDISVVPPKKNQNLSTEKRDVALACLITIVGKNPQRDFAFPSYPPRATRDKRGQVIRRVYVRRYSVPNNSTIVLAFYSSKDREAAHKKWNDWWAKNKSKYLKPVAPKQPAPKQQPKQQPKQPALKDTKT